VVNIKPQKLTVTPIIHLRTPASDACFLKVIVGGRWNLIELQYHGLHPWLLLDAPSALLPNEFLRNFVLLSGLSLRQTGLWLKKEKSIRKTSVSELVEL